MNKINCVLLVDDDEITNFLNQKLFAKLDHINHVQIINNADEALNFIIKFHNINNECPEFILIDINMPDMSGYEFLTKFKALNLQSPRSTKIIMLTASSNRRDIEKINGMELVSYLQKPLTKEKLDIILKM